MWTATWFPCPPFQVQIELKVRRIDRRILLLDWQSMQLLQKSLHLDTVRIVRGPDFVSGGLQRLVDIGL